MAETIPMTKELLLLVLSLILSPPFVTAEGGSTSTSCAAALIVVSTLMLLLIAAYVAYYITRYGNGCLGAATDGNRDPVVSAADKRLRAVAVVPVEALPSIQFSVIKMLKLGEVELECAVCLIEFKDHEILNLLPDCCHVFHSDCIKPWLASHVTCPVCRASLDKVSGAAKSTVLDRVSRAVPKPADLHSDVGN